MQDLEDTISPLERAGRCFQLAWRALTTNIHRDYLEDPSSKTMLHRNSLSLKSTSKAAEATSVWVECDLVQSIEIKTTNTKFVFCKGNLSSLNESFWHSSLLEEAMISSSLRTSSSCTGAYTAEMSLAVVQKTIQDSGYFHQAPEFTPIACYESWNDSFIFFYLGIPIRGLKRHYPYPNASIAKLSLNFP